MAQSLEEWLENISELVQDALHDYPGKNQDNNQITSYGDKYLKKYPRSLYFLSELFFRNANSTEKLQVIAKRIFNSRQKIKEWKSGKDNFAKWYADPERGKQCASCGCTIKELMEFFLKRKPKSGRGLSWEIDRKNPDGKYDPNNCALLCYYCNNAKTDVFIDKEFYKDKKNRRIGGSIGLAIKATLNQRSNET